ncbi:MAG: S9 family peptidase [Planctomycetes bacterium]|nr:S9 family peptidase [Planctomycetota bacterium]
MSRTNPLARTRALSITAVLILALCGAVPLRAQAGPGPDATAATAAAAKADALTLEKLFPKKGLFGPTASGIEFSKDGRYAAWLHRPYVERRHGQDLYLLEIATGTVRRLTDARTMSAFQNQARDVLADREDKQKKRAEKAKQAAANKLLEEKSKPPGEQGGAGVAASPPAAAPGTPPDAAREAARARMHIDTSVGEEDAEDEKAPRYAGINSFAWSPKTAALLFSSQGDLYRYELAEGRIERLTHTRSSEGQAAWLPDGSGFTFLDDARLFRMRFASHVVEELTPPLEGDERIAGYELSDDGRRAVFVVRKGRSAMDGERRVKIAKYTGRFVEVQEVPRHVSDDPVGKGESRIYLWDLDAAMREDGSLWLVHKFENTGPRDVVRTPDWAPDGSRVVFATFEQKSGQVLIHESVFPEGEAAKPKPEEKSEVPGRFKRVLERPAKVVYRFLHDGGPNTPAMVSPSWLADSRHVLFLSEQSGYRHLHVLDPRYESQRQLTAGVFEVYPIRLSEDRKTVFVAATKEHSSRLDAYRVDVASGAMTRLSPRDGSWEDVAVADDGHLLGNFSAWGNGGAELTHVAPDGLVTTLTDSHPEFVRRATDRRPELFTYENRNGQAISGFLFEPTRPAGEKRPLLIYVYGGPLGTRKQVVDGSYHGDAYFLARYFAEVHGWVCVTIDPRGMSGYGALFEKANFEQVGRPQTEDLADGVKWLVANRGVDPQKVAMHGWSFGGFQTQMCMYTEPDVFKFGIAGAGPTEWQNYNSWYSTGTIGPSRTGATDLEKFSLLPLAKNLKGRLLLVHGMEDSNVLYQDTVRVYRELLKAGKETLVELFLDPTGGHGLGGDVERLARARKYEEFLVRCLGTAPKAGG